MNQHTGYQCCRVVEDNNLNVCFKCGRLNHSSKNCKNETKCLKCSGDHETNACKGDTIKCVNCVNFIIKNLIRTGAQIIIQMIPINVNTSNLK